MIVQSDIRQWNIILFRLIESQSLETWLLRLIEFMLMHCDSLTLLLLSFISKLWIRDEDVASVISVDVFRSADRRVSIKDCCAGDPDNACCVPLTDCCASGTDNDWFWFCIIPLWLCGTAILLMSILDVAVSLGQMYH